MLFADRIRQLRGEKQLVQRQFAAVMDIDTPRFSIIERSERERMIAIAKILEYDEIKLLTLWLADKITAVVADKKTFNYCVRSEFEKITGWRKRIENQ